MEIKRQLDPEILREAALFREQVDIIKSIFEPICIVNKSVSFHLFSVSRDASNGFVNDRNSTWWSSASIVEKTANINWTKQI